MYRQSSGRNPRSKGIKVKNVLQICLLLAVCFWLIYQVKHSHEKKKEFDESDVKASSSDALIRLGRKDIRTRVGETLNKDENHDELSDEEEINGEEVDENKHDEDEIEDKKVDVKEEDDDETDEHEQEKSDAEVDREVDVEETQEREDGDENETQNKDSEDGHGQIDKEESSSEETDHDGDDSSTHEAREEHYKADDASSAVTHEHPENILEVENKENEETYKIESRKELQVGGGEVAGDGHKSDVTTTETKEDLLDNSANGSSPNNMVTEGSNDHLEDRGLPSENVTETKPEPGLAQGIITEGVSAGGSDLHTNNSVVNVNSTVSDAKEFPNTEILFEAGNNTEVLLENNNEIEGEKSDTSDGTDENLETTENSEEVQQDAIDMSDTSNLMHEKDVRTDLETLPEIQTEGADNEDAAE